MFCGRMSTSIRSMQPGEDSNEDVIGVPINKAAGIIGVSRQRLIGWHFSGLLSPASDAAFWGERRWLYGLDELAAGRVLVLIENGGVDIRKLSRQIGAYRSGGWQNPLTELTWAIDRPARKAYASEDGEHWMGDDNGWPSQYVAREIINMSEVRAQVREAATERRGAAGVVVQSRGKRVFAGTRVPVSAVKSWIEFGADDARIMEAYPSLTQEDIQVVRGELQQAG